MKHRPQRHRGFTLIELMVVIGIIVLASGIALPTISSLFNAGADAQAYNTLASMLTVARSQAIINNAFVAVHVQLSDREDTDGRTYAAILIWDEDAATPAFKMLEGFVPQPIPGGYAFGKLTSDFITGDNYTGITDSELEDFTTMTFIFNPSGQLTTTVNGVNPVFATTGLFTSTEGAAIPSSNETILWSNPAIPGSASAKPGVTAVTLFRYVDLVARSSSDRAAYLNDAGQFLAINFYTGQLMARE